MKIFLSVFVFISFTAFAQTHELLQTEESPETQIVEASCGSCNFGLKGGCHLAVKIDGKAYPVDGSKLHDHGDPHSRDGMCNAVRKAEVSGEIVKGRFKATSFVVLPNEESDKE